MREMTYGWNLEMQMRAARAGLRILEVPVMHGRRIAGRSKVAGTLRGSVKAGFRILATFARIACERPSPDPLPACGKREGPAKREGEGQSPALNSHDAP
jgi:hypothetical protein